MNYLAHCLLSHETPAAVLGGMLGDFVKGALDGRFDSPIKEGIVLHRKIDSYTDAHSVVLASKKLVSRQRRRYAGIMVDIFYDHFLARHWAEFSVTPLPDFTRRIYGVLNQHREFLPGRLQHILPYMAGDDWLGSYAELWAVDAALNGMSKRIKRENGLVNSVEELRANYAQLEDHFLHFFPDLVQYVSACKRC